MTVAATPTCTALNDKTTEIANTTALAEGPTKLNDPSATNTAIVTNEIQKDGAKAEDTHSVVNKSIPEETKAVEEAAAANEANAEETKTEAANTEEAKADEPKAEESKAEESKEATLEEPSVDKANDEAPRKDKGAASNIANAVTTDTALAVEQSAKEVSDKRKPEEDKLKDEESPSKKAKTETETSK